VDEAVVGDAAHLDARCLALCEHPLQTVLVYFQGDVEVIVVLRLEVEGAVGSLEEGEARAVVHAIEAVQHVGAPAAFGLLDAERIGERQTEEVLVEAPRFLGVAAAVRVVMQSFDHDPASIYCKVTNCWSFTIPAKP